MPNDAQYMRDYRRTPEGKASLAKQKRREVARRRAISELIQQFPVQWEAVLKKHLDQVEKESE